jgi:hypothetical protein
VWAFVGEEHQQGREGTDYNVTFEVKNEGNK